MRSLRDIIRRAKVRRAAKQAIAFEQRSLETHRKLASVQEEFGTLFNEACAAFFEIDPAGINYEENTDEYSPEVTTTLPRLAEAASPEDVRRILGEEFRWWFGWGNYDRSRLDPLAHRLWDLWVAHESRT